MFGIPTWLLCLFVVIGVVLFCRAVPDVRDRPATRTGGGQRSPGVSRSLSVDLLNC